MSLRMPRRSLLCSHRKLALLPLPLSFGSGRVRPAAPRGWWESSWVSTGLTQGSWEENPTSEGCVLPVGQLSQLLKRKGVVCCSFHCLQKESNIGMPMQHIPIYTVLDLLRKRPLRLTLLNLDRACSVFSDSRSSNYLLKTSQLEIRPQICRPLLNH